MITHDQLIYSLTKKYPELTHGVDFWVGQEMNGEEQLSDAKIYVWKSEAVDEPEPEVYMKLVKADKKAYNASLAPAIERGWRNSELDRADKELLKAEDGDGVGEPAAWRAYRKALRAWPDSKDFPKSAKRPVAPDFVEAT